MDNQQRKVVEKLLTAQRSFLLAIHLIFEAVHDNLEISENVDLKAMFKTSWEEAMECTTELATVLNVKPSSAQEISEEVVNKLILDDQRHIDLEALYGSSSTDKDTIS